MEKIGILHPGEMGKSIAASARLGGNQVFWSSEGRSLKTRQRAEAQGLLDLGSLTALCETCSVIISVCPPHAAEGLASQVIEKGFKGVYLDANAISPQRAASIWHSMEAAGIEFLDGGIIGGPAWEPGKTRLYLSGPSAGRVAGCFKSGPLEAVVLGKEIGKASALKMCYASFSKGTTALLCTALAASQALGVREALEKQWEQDEAGAAERAERRVVRVTAKAWRFEGEMMEISETFAAAGLTPGLHSSAAEVYRRISSFKDSTETPSLEVVLRALLEDSGAP